MQLSAATAASGEQPPVTVALASLLKRLGSKRAFVAAARELLELVIARFDGASRDEQAQLFAAVGRTVSLLRSRYTSPRFWSVGCELVFASLAIMDSAEQQASLQEWVALAEEQLQEGELKALRAEATARAAANRPAPSAAPAELRSFMDNAYDVNAILAAQTNAGDATLGGDLSEHLANLLGGISSGEQALDLSALMEAHMGSAGPPPASRDARAALDVVTITEAGQTCPVCQEEMVLRSKCTKLPCSHVFHDECVREWLQRHCSCPMCRFALPTEKRNFDREADEIAARDAVESGLYS